MITILVGDVTEYLALEAAKIDHRAQIITQQNFQDLPNGVYYVSLGDFDNLYDFVQTLQQANHLIYCPPETWSDEKKSNSRMKFWTEYYLMYFLNYTKISGQELLPLMPEDKKIMLDLADTRTSSGRQLWVTGCSISHGVGVEPDQRYGQLLAQKLDLPVSFLTQGGTSVRWAADQILRSDVRPGDIVVWGITGFARMPFYRDQTVLKISAQYYDQHRDFNSVIPLERLDDDNMAYTNLGLIHAVINFCAKAKAQLFLFGLLVDHHTLKWTADLPRYTQFYGCFGFDQDPYLDLGTDDIHPGPGMHEWYCDQMYEIIQKHLKD